MFSRGGSLLLSIYADGRSSGRCLYIGLEASVTEPTLLRGETYSEFVLDHTDIHRLVYISFLGQADCAICTESEKSYRDLVARVMASMTPSPRPLPPPSHPSYR